MNKQIRLGRTELMVNRIGLGANAVGGHNLFSNLSDTTGESIINTALDNGINFLDTAFAYGLGRSEEIIGEVLLEKGKRDNLVIATKNMENRPELLKGIVEESLKRLKTDYIDLFYIHFPDEFTPKDETIGALKKLKDEGLIRAIGVSNFSIEQLKEANKDGYIDVIQDEYNLLNRTKENDILPYAALHGISFIPYYPLASGLLSGKYTKETQLSKEHLRSTMFQPEHYFQNINKVEKLRSMAEDKNVDISHLVLAWYLKQSTIDVVIPGAKVPEQVLSNLKTLSVKLSQEEVDRIDQIFA